MENAFTDEPLTCHVWRELVEFIEHIFGKKAVIPAYPLV